MATLTKTRELKGAFEDVRDVVLREGGKGPIINAMIEMDGAEMSVPAIVVASKWMTDEELDVFAELLIEEGGYVAWNCADEWMIGATAFLRRYGLLKESRGMFDEWGACYDIQGLTPKAAILKVTKDYPSWGEWIGGIVGCMGYWLSKDRDKDGWAHQMRPAIMDAIRWAAQHGVDH